MKQYLNLCIILLVAKLISGKKSTTELPLCPTNIQYLPQNLPMHCRMPNPPSDNQPFTFPISASMPGSFPMPGPMPMPESMPGPMPMPESIPMPGSIQVAGSMPRPGSIPFLSPMPMPGPMPVPLPGIPMLPPPGPAHKLPVIVMPFYSPDPVFKKNGSHRRRSLKRKFDFHTDTDRSSSSETDTDSSTSSDRDSGHGWWKSSKEFPRNARKPKRGRKLRRRKHVKKDLLTPILQYVSKDGYVIFEKQISQREAKQWLKGNSNINEAKNVKKNDIKEPIEFNDTSEHGVRIDEIEKTIGKIKSDRNAKVKNSHNAGKKRRQRK